MTHAEKIKLLKRWKSAHDALEAALSPMEKAFGRDYFEGEIAKAAWGNFDLTTDLVAQALGDTAGWCSWYAHENAFGRKCMEAGPVDDMRKINSFARLLWVIGAAA